MSADHHGMQRRAAFVVIALATLIATLTAGPAAAQSATSALTWSVNSIGTTFRPGQAIPLQAIVTNRGLAPCGLLASATGTVHVIAATRDGASLAPRFSRDLPVDGAAAALGPLETGVAVGATASFRLDAGGPQGLTVATVQRDGSILVASWPTSAVGNYRLMLAYRVPTLAGSPACPTMTNTVTVAYAVATPRAGITWWWIVLGIVVVVIALIAAILLIRRRRIGPGVAVALLLAAFVGVVAHAPAARANVVFNSGSDGVRQKQYDGCESQFKAFDPTLWSDLNGPDKPLVTVYPWVFSSREDLTGGTPRDSFIRWDNEDKKHIEGDAAGVNYVPCAELYHELVHAQDAANGKLSDRMCDDTGVLYDEVRATIRENAFRARYGGAQRRTYDGHKIPSTLAGCTPSTKPAPPAGRTRHCNVDRCAVTNGDPHLTTFDGVHYDFQAVGEFTAVSTTTGDLVMQVRQSAFMQTRTISVNTAVALQVGATRLGFYLVDGVIDVHRDRTSVTVADGVTPLSEGATITRSDDPYSGVAYDVSWPDGTIVSVSQAGAWGLVATVTPAPARAGTLSGLLGNFDGKAENDVSAPSGSPLAQPVTFDSLYPAFADSWRVTDGGSLFDYAPGETTATFTDRSFPARPETTSDLTGAQRATATTACRIARVTDVVALDGCILDVAMSDQADFALSAANVQNTGVSGGGTAAQPGSSTLTAAVTQAGGTARVTFPGIKGQRIYVQVVATTLPVRCDQLTLYKPNNTLLSGGSCTGSAAYIDGTLLPADGIYAIVIGPSAATGTMTLRVISMADEMIAASIDGAAVTATIAAPGAQARIIFDGVRGQNVFVEASDVTLPSDCGAIQLLGPDGKELTAGCLTTPAGFIDVTSLPSTGPYAVLVDPDSDHVGQATLRITDAVNQQTSTTIGAPPVTMTIAQPGAVARLTFMATAGAKVTITAAESTLPADCQLLLLGPDKNVIDESCIDGAGRIASAALPASGEYTVLIDPDADHTGHVAVAVTSVAR